MALSYAVTFRGKTACPCLAEWLPVFEAELIRRGVVAESIDIAQLIGAAAASADTHSTGGAFDIWQHDDLTVWVARQMGADATWARTTGSFATNQHTHGVLTGCPHNSAARYQIDEVRAGGDGLIGTNPDPGPRPLSGRTWREGIAWAKTQQEDDMTDPATKAQLDRIEALLKADRKRDQERMTKLKKLLSKVRADVKDAATVAEIEAALAEDAG